MVLDSWSNGMVRATLPSTLPQFPNMTIVQSGRDQFPVDRHALPVGPIGHSRSEHADAPPLEALTKRGTWRWLWSAAMLAALQSHRPRLNKLLALGTFTRPVSKRQTA